MRENLNVIAAYVIMLGLIILVGFLQSWSIALSILCFCLISAVMTMGANIQWGYAGLINFGIMGYTALGGLAAVLVSVPPVREAWQVGGLNMILCAFLIALMVFSIRFIIKKYNKSNKRNYGIAFVIITGLVLLRLISGPAIESIEAISPATTGFLGGMGLPILFSWIVGAFFAGGLAYVIGKIALGLRADYLAIATLLISEIVIAVIKHEDWLSRGVKNVIGLKRPVPYEIDLQTKEWFINLVEKFNQGTLNLITDTLEKQQLLKQLVIESINSICKIMFCRTFYGCSGNNSFNHNSKSTLLSLGKNDESN